jgi:hypothetical protein
LEDCRGQLAQLVLLRLRFHDTARSAAILMPVGSHGEKPQRLIAGDECCPQRATHSEKKPTVFRIENSIRFGGVRTHWLGELWVPPSLLRRYGATAFAWLAEPKFTLRR